MQWLYLFLPFLFDFCSPKLGNPVNYLQSKVPSYVVLEKVPKWPTWHNHQSLTRCWMSLKELISRNSGKMKKIAATYLRIQTWTTDCAIPFRYLRKISPRFSNASTRKLLKVSFYQKSNYHLWFRPHLNFPPKSRPRFLENGTFQSIPNLKWRIFYIFKQTKFQF